MRLTAKVRLETSDVEFRALKETLATANECANWISDRALRTKTLRQYDIHKMTYAEARMRFPLSAQVVVRIIAKVADAYKLDQTTRRMFQPTGSIAYDDRILTWYLDKHTVSIWTVNGRLKIQFAAGPRQAAMLQNQQGESDLILHRGAFYLAATCNVEEPAAADVDDFLGVDLGVINIATDSDGKRYSGSMLKSVRHRHRRLRQRLQKKHTQAAKRRLKKLAGKERRFAAWVNHNVSKQIVASAKGTGRGIVIEDLKHIRNRVKVGHKQRAILHSWAFSQLRLFLEYKTRLAGVPLILVDPANSSRQCNRCHYVSNSNRPNQSTFRCRACGHQDHADLNAAANLRNRGRAACKPAILRAALGDLSRSVKLPAFSR